MKTRIHRRKRWDEQGVSEVVGTILTLSITVILFSGIITMVNRFPVPSENVFTDFDAKLEPIDDWTLGAYVTVTNTGGIILVNWSTRIILSVDNYTYSLDTVGTFINRTYGLNYPGVAVDEDWHTGETWRIWLYNGEISSNSNVGFMIIDIERNTVVWSIDIQGTINEFGPVINDIWVDSDLDSIRRDPIDYGRDFYLYASVSDPDGDLNVTSIRADLSSIDPAWGNIPLTLDANGSFRSDNLTGPNAGTVPIGYHYVIVYAHDTAVPHHDSSGVGRVPLGQDIGDQPNLVIRGDNIEVNPINPVNGNSIVISVLVSNYGGSCNALLELYDEIGTNSTLITSQEMSIPMAPSQIRSRPISYQVWGGGIHIIRAEVFPMSVEDFDPSDNINETEINVMPTILLVDDDAHPFDRSPYDTVSPMRAALEASDFNYDLYVINPGYDGPEYEFGEMRLRNYDIVIWMCGYESDTLTASDRINLYKFLHDDAGTGRAGSLWLISQKILHNPNAQMLAFINAELKVASVSVPGPSFGPNNLTGVAGNPVSDEWNATVIDVIERAPGEGDSYIITPDFMTFPGVVETTFIVGGNITEANALNYEDVNTSERLLFFPFEYSRIATNADQTQVTYKAIMWLGNITRRLGRDLAISQQITDPYFVFFNQDVTVSAVIRNNGGTVEDNVEAVLIVDDQPLIGTHMFTNLTVPGLGGSVSISATWKANTLGLHILKWYVDPNDYVEETNENNNMVPSYVSTGEVFVKYRILVVDDDGSKNNNDPPSLLNNETALLTDSINRLGYEYEYNGINSTYIVNVSDDGPDIDLLGDYSAVLWVTGSALSGLTLADNITLIKYMEDYDGHLWLVGTDPWSGIPGSDLAGTMGIGSITPDAGLTGSLMGVVNSSISHGMNIPVIDCPEADYLTPAFGAEGVFYQDAALDYSAVMYDNVEYRSVAFGFNFSTFYGSAADLISGDNAMDEVTYLALRWLGKPETRKEARITPIDTYLSDMHPLIGGAYILRATVHNVGASETNILVRFMDGDTQIGSDSISIEPGARMSAEVIWRPLYAGQRTINILVDPIAEVPEIFEWFNNNVSFGIYVYFFWDDMESGASKWTHGSTIININGESPLDYYSSYTTLSTDISTEWDYGLTYGVDNVTTYSHSYPHAYHIREGTGLFGEANVLISFAIDDSRSMWMRWYDVNDTVDSDGDGDPTNDDDETWLEAAKNAILSLLTQLSDDSVVVSIWDFSGGGERRYAGPNETIGGGRQATDILTPTQIARPPIRLGDTFNSTINGTPIDGRQYIRDEIIAMTNPSGQTIIWDSVGEAYKDTQHFQSSYPDLLPVVIVLSDGADLQAADTSAPQAQKFESGSNYWCPWDGEVNGTINYPMHRGKYTFDMYDPAGSTQWLEAMNHGGSVIKDRVGLLHAGMMIFTIGLGLENHTDPWSPAIPDWPGEILDYSSARCTDTSVSPPCDESGTVEYNLWRIANTTGAEYFHAPSPDELEDIFMQLGMFLASGFNQTRSGTPEPETRAVHDNFDKRAVTETFDLTGVEKAQVTFWHKYNILQGGNGVFLQVAYKDPTVDGDGDGDPTNDWDFKYIIPPGQYTGMLYYLEDIEDDFGNLIKWCWNGVSGEGQFGWDYASLDISPFVPEPYRSEVKLAFNYTQFGGGTGIGWYLDDVKVTVSRNDNASLLPTTKDVWLLNGTVAHSGSYSWSNVDPDPMNGYYMKTGIDNSLVTAPVDLSNAKNAYLSAYLRFNINQESGAPPDGFRVEVTSNGGVVWTAINLGVRSGWGVSGTGWDGDDGNATDGKSFTGLPDSGNPITDDYWIEIGTLSRINIDLSAWLGNQIQIRFRVVTNNLLDTSYHHYENPANFGGFFVDDVEVKGETLYG